MNKECEVLLTARLSLAELCGRKDFCKGHALNNALRRDPADVLATIYWCRKIQQQSGWKTPYAIGAVVTPNSYVKTDKPRVHRHPNQWSKYSKGKHRPSPAMLARTEAVYPGTSKEIEWTIWSVLKRMPETTAAIEIFKAKLPADVQSQMLRAQKASAAGYLGVLRTVGRTLERVGNLDALAALVLLLKSAELEGRSEEANQWVWHIYRCLFILSEHLLMGGIACPLFDLLEVRVLKGVSHEGWRYSFPSDLFLHIADAFAHRRSRLKEAPLSSLMVKKDASRLQRILDGRAGWDSKFAFNPFKGPAARETVFTEATLRACLETMCLFSWGWNMLASGGHPGMPPAKVWAGKDLWARSQPCAPYSRDRESNTDLLSEGIDDHQD